MNESIREETCLLLTKFRRNNYFFNDFTLLKKKKLLLISIFPNMYMLNWSVLKMRNRSGIENTISINIYPLNRIEATNVLETRRKYTNKYIP